MINHAVRVAFLSLLALSAGSEAFAGDSQPLLGKPGKLLFEDDFARTEMAPKWKIGKGFWAVQDGVATAAENPADKHAAYSYANPRFPFKDIVAEYSIKFDGSDRVHLMMEDNTYKGSHAGHIIRASIMPRQVQLCDMKFGGMKNEIFTKMQDPKTTPEEKKEIQASIKDKTATFKADFDPAQWHQVRVEVVGDEMLISIDGKPAGYFKSEGVDHPTKNMLGFTVGKKSAMLKDVKVWEATASPDWAAHRADVIAGLTK